MATPYRVCTNCGSNLDPCERCDCQDNKTEQEDKQHDNHTEPAQN